MEYSVSHGQFYRRALKGSYLVTGTAVVLNIEWWMLVEIVSQKAKLTICLGLFGDHGIVSRIG